MTDPRSALDQHRDTFRAELDHAQIRLTRRRRRRARGLTAAVPLAAASLLALALWPGDRGTVLERATAALSPDTGVIHFQVENELIGAAEQICTDDPADVWLQTGPNAPTTPRWRIRGNSSRCLTGPTAEALGHMNSGRTDVWYDGTNRSTYAIDDGWVEHLTDVTPADAAFPDPTGFSSGDHWWESVDPITGLRRLIASGKVHPAGDGTIDGRAVSYLEGPDQAIEPGDSVLRIAFDAQSFQPVDITRRLKNPPEDRPADFGIGTRLRFLAYDAATERDLTPAIPAGTDEASRDYREFRKAVRAAKAYPPEPISSAERRRAEQRFAELHPNATTP